MFRGTSAEQDARFSDKEAKLLRTTKFPASFARRVDRSRVNWDVAKSWAAKRLAALGVDDDITVGFALNALEGGDSVDPRRLQLLLTPMLDEDCPRFVEELWDLLLDAQDSPGGVPSALVEQKKAEIAAAASVAASAPPVAVQQQQSKQKQKQKPAFAPLK